MQWQKMVLAVLALPTMLVMVAATSPTTTSTTTTSSVTSTSVIDPVCAFTATGCVSPSPSTAADPTANAGVRGASTGPSVPSTGGDGTALLGLAALPFLGLGVAAIRWARRR